MKCLGMTALMFASGNGHNGVAKVLLDSAAEIDERNGQGSTSLMLASVAGHATTLKLLLSR